MVDTRTLSDEEYGQIQSRRLEAALAHFRALPQDRRDKYAEELIRGIIILAGELGLDWPEQLHLADVLEKYIGRQAKAQIAGA